MPHLPPKPCRVPGCPSIGVCAKHANSPARRLYNDQRGSSAQQGYGSRWRKQRAEYIKKHPYCVTCGRPATDVDHIHPRRMGGADHETNYRALCHACHSRKTAMERKNLRGI
jgi:5-methylcytosine-specific restriction protein A